ncbi:MAG: hypothetical protein ABSC06_38930, partial [Rhodopila sp.]
WVLLLKGTQSDTPLPGKALKSAIFGGVRSSIFTQRWQGDFWGRMSDGIPAPPDRSDSRVPKTLESGTTANRAEMRGKRGKACSTTMF